MSKQFEPKPNATPLAHMAKVRAKLTMRGGLPRVPRSRGILPEYQTATINDEKILIAQHFIPWYRRDALLHAMWRNGKYKKGKVDWLMECVWEFMPCASDDTGQKFLYDITMWISVRYVDMGPTVNQPSNKIHIQSLSNLLEPQALAKSD